MRDKVKRFISILMTALMLVNLMPVGALADGITSIGYKPETVEDYDKTVYVYVKVTGNLNGLELNNHRWCTVGKVTGLDMPNPKSYNGKGHMSNVSGYSASSVGRGMYGFNPFDKNQSIDRSKVTWKGGDYGFVAVDTGADDYVGSGWTWHLDGYIDISQVESSYKIRYVDYDNKKIILQDNVESGRGKPGTLIKHTAPRTLDGGYEIFGDTEQTFKLGQIDNTFDIYYRRPYGYTVEYYYDGVKDEHATVTGSAWCNEQITQYTDKPKVGYELDKTKTTKLPLTIGTDESKNVIKVYYKKIGYTVKYNPGEHGTFEEKDHTYTRHYNDLTPAYDEENPTAIPEGEPGYKFDGWTPEVADKVTGDVTYTAKWEPDTKQKAEVIYITDGNGTLWGGPAIKQITQFVQIVTGKVVREDGSVIGDKLTTIPTYPKEGYEFDHWIRVTPEKKIEGADSALTDEQARPLLNQKDGLYQETVFKAIFRPRTDLSYTVNYYWNGTTTKVADSKTVDKQTFDSTVTESPIGADGYTPVSNDSQSIKIKANSAENVINFYYYKNVELTANSDEKTYNGNEQTVKPGYTCSEKNVTFDNIAEPSGKGTDAGEYPVTFAKGTVGKVDTSKKYIVTVANPGTLTINPRAVTLTSEGGSKPYDGTALTKPEVAVGGDGFVAGEVSDIKATGSVTYVSEGEVTNTITYTEGENFKASNYDIQKAEGKLSITAAADKVTVTITGNKVTEKYDGTEKTAKDYTVSIDNDLYTATDFEFKGNAEVKGTDASTYDMGLNKSQFKNKNSNFSDSNVEFVVTDGQLVINPRPVTLTSEGGSKPYDGTALTKPEVAVGGDGFVVGEATDIKATGSVTYVSEGEVTNTITYKTSDKFNADNYTITKTEGKLKVTPRPVTLTSGSAERVYNGEALTKNEVTASTGENEGFVEGQGATYNVTGSQTNVGTSNNTFTYTLNKGTKANNYSIELVPGKLEVTPVTDEVIVTITGRTGEMLYDGKEHSVFGYDLTVSNALYTPKEDMQFNGIDADATAKGTDAGTYPIGLTAEDFTNKSKNFSKVTFVVTDGYVKINPRAVTLTSETAGKTYDGTALEKPVVTVGGDGFVEGQVTEIKATGSVTNAGSVANTITFTPDKETFKEGNYAITKTEGILTIKKRSVRITSQSATKTYDGSALTRPAVTITGDGFVPGELAKAEATGSITNVGSTPNTIRYTTTGAFNAANYSISLSVGTLTVTEKPKPEPRRTFNLTINYVYQNGKRAAASYNRGGLKNGETFDITSPVIAGYTASETVVSGTIYNRDIKVTVIYTANGVNLDDYGVPLGLGNITMNVGDCFE